VHTDPAPWPDGTFEVDDPRAWFRSERQTFLPMPARRQAMFTIGVDCVSLAAAVETPERAARLHAAIASMSPAVLAYRSLAPVREALLAWLARRAGAGTV
jgi:hypothetical protein